MYADIIPPGLFDGEGKRVGGTLLPLAILIGLGGVVLQNLAQSALYDGIKTLVNRWRARSGGENALWPSVQIGVADPADPDKKPNYYIVIATNDDAGLRAALASLPPLPKPDEPGWVYDSGEKRWKPHRH